MKGAFNKIFNFIVQIVGVIVTLIAIGLARAYLQRGYRLEVYTVTIGIIILIALGWIIRTWWSNKRDQNNKQNKLFESKTVNATWKRYSKTSGTILLFVLLLGIITGLFYWYEVRPSQARTECDEITRDKANSTNSPTKVYDTFYEACLHSKGLE